MVETTVWYGRTIQPEPYHAITVKLSETVEVPDDIEGKNLKAIRFEIFQNLKLEVEQQLKEDLAEWIKTKGEFPEIPPGSSQQQPQTPTDTAIVIDGINNMRWKSYSRKDDQNKGLPANDTEPAWAFANDRNIPHQLSMLLEKEKKVLVNFSGVVLEVAFSGRNNSLISRRTPSKKGNGVNQRRY
jgi:hypothetical protein